MFLFALCLSCGGHAWAGDVTDFSVVNNAMTTWRIDGLDNPPLTLLRGKTYTFSMQGVSAVHPFNINTTNTTGSANLYNEGVTNNGASGSQVLTFVVPDNAPDSLHYNCGNHGSMNGPISILTDEIFAAGFD
jgi:hypothetical protein